MSEEIPLISKVNKLSLPATILIASIILGGFYYASEVSKQKSIERQQEIKLEDERRLETKAESQKNEEALHRSLCVTQAQENAIKLNEDSCKRGEYCLKGENMYLVKQYENSYNTCLQSYRLE